MKKSLIIIIIILTLIVLGFLIFYKTPEGESLIELELRTKNSSQSNQNNDNPEINSETTSPTSLTGGDSSGSGGSSSGGNSEEPLPEDIETRPCGFYTEEYEICTGTCPEGECVSEGRSCYCKK